MRGLDLEFAELLRWLHMLGLISVVGQVRAGQCAVWARHRGGRGRSSPATSRSHASVSGLGFVVVSRSQHA